MARVDRRAPLAIPDNVRVAISRRLSHLSALANRTLVVAAVVGREFDFPVLRAALPEAAEEALLHVMDDALQAHVIEPHPSRGEEWYQFRHALIRDALYESISPSRRARWHATIAQALETHLGDHVEDRAAELARNAAAAGALIEPSILAKYSCIAGERLLAAHAFEEALSHFERAWRAREGLPFDASAAAMLVGLGRAQAATAVRWNRQQGWVTLRRALDYYLKAGEISQAIAVATDPHISVEGATGVAATIRQLHDLAPRGSLEEGRLLARMGAAEYFETGDYSAAQVAFARALDIAAAQRDAGLELRTLAYTALQAMFDPIVPKGTCGYVKSDYFDDIPRAMVDDLVAWAERKPYAMSMARLNHFGGAMSRIADDATPFPHRQALFAFSPDALWNRPEEADASVRWAKGYWQALRAYAPRGAYVNFMQEEGEDRVRESYQGNYDRLVQIKRRYDPRNLFRLNQNIKP
jgi:tetratricopeptide (TPR) repeat protein